MEYWILAYYYIGAMDDPAAEVVRHKEFFQGRDFRGRIYISEQGINGQASGGEGAVREYMEWMARRFGGMTFKVDRAEEHAFPKMTVKYRKQLVAIDREVDLSLRGKRVRPEAWKQMLEERSEETVLLDVRNNYEWKVGHFEGAELPALETFREFPAYARTLKERCNAVMMYCTGGIRCEFYSAVLKSEGIEEVYQLEGGVIGYGHEVGVKHWKGKLFVFDDRLVVPIGEGSEPIAQCGHCKVSCDVYYNCANVDCNALFVCCIDCLRAHRGCCSAECAGAKRVRPYQESAKPFRKLGTSCPLAAKLA